MSIEWLTPHWPVPPNVRAISTLRGGGVSVGPYASLNLGIHVQDAPEAVAENRRRLRMAAELPGEPAWLAQVHGVRIADLDVPGPGPETGPPVADGASTRIPGRVCAILTADCLPILLASEAGDAVAAVHAGWRGLAGGVIESAVKALGIDPGAILAWLGPAIGPEHFEVGPEVREHLLRDDPGAGAAFVPNARDRFMANLPDLARRRLERLGIVRLFGERECTHARADRYFSHRRDGHTGRQATLIWLDRMP